MLVVVVTAAVSPDNALRRLLLRVRSKSRIRRFSASFSTLAASMSARYLAFSSMRGRWKAVMDVGEVADGIPGMIGRLPW